LYFFENSRATEDEIASPSPSGSDPDSPESSRSSIDTPAHSESDVEERSQYEVGKVADRGSARLEGEASKGAEDDEAPPDDDESEGCDDELEGEDEEDEKRSDAEGEDLGKESEEGEGGGKESEEDEEDEARGSEEDEEAMESEEEEKESEEDEEEARESEEDEEEARESEEDEEQALEEDVEDDEILEELSEDAGPAADGRRPPAAIAQMGNSCYFHSTLLLLYNMKDAVDKFKVDKNNSQLFTKLRKALQMMSERVVIKDDTELKNLYKLVQRRIFNERGAQQDAPGMLSGLFELVKNDQQLVENFQSETTFQFSNVEIKALACSIDGEVLLITGKPLDDFERKWSLWRKDEKKNAKSLVLANWAFDKKNQIIVKKPKKPKELDREQYCGLERAAVSQVVQTDYEKVDTRKFEVIGPILKIPLPTSGKGTRKPCAIVQKYLSKPQQSVVARARHDLDLFNFQCLQTTAIIPPTAKYFIVQLTFRVTRDMKVRFEYEDAVPGYELICVVHKTGGAYGGHYRTSLKFHGRWHAYDDFPLTRKHIQHPSASAPPYLLLFRRI
jgi:hypothetical protein